jgi:hypothetical protein
MDAVLAHIPTAEIEQCAVQSEAAEEADPA